jgi:acyl-CoA reductase-like NAD-dependent aldehyde dehydrogenase
MAEARVTASDSHAARERARAAAEVVRGWPLEQRAEAIERAARTLLEAGSTLGAELRAELLASTGLSAPVIEHGLQTTLSLFERAALCALHARAPRDAERAPEVATVLLAGNVFSAAARPLLLPLLCGVGVLAKASSTDDALPHYLARALAAVDAQLGAACQVLTFAHDDAAASAGLLQGAELISVYGSDETVATVRASAPPDARVLAHGHGLGAIFIARETLVSAAAAYDLAERAARDVAAYDQRGCLSPHFVLVERGGAVDARALARQIATALAALERELPRGELPQDAAAAQLQWRGVAAAIGELFVRARSAISYEGALALRTSPGHRNLAVHDCADVSQARTQLSQLGEHLKALAVGGEKARRILSGVAPYTCEPGAMQTPPIDVALDRLHPLAGMSSVDRSSST